MIRSMKKSIIFWNILVLVLMIFIYWLLSPEEIKTMTLAKIIPKVVIHFEKAREAWVESSTLPEELAGYTENSSDTGILKDWPENSESLTRICDVLSTGLAYSWKNQDREDGKRALVVAEDYLQKLEIEIYKRGTFNQSGLLIRNLWKGPEFSLSLTIRRFLTAYLLTSNARNKDCAAKLMLSVIPKLPLMFAGKFHYHTVRLLGSWVLAHNRLGTLNNAPNYSVYQDCLGYLKNISTARHKMGLHRDLSFYKLDKVLAFKNLDKYCDERLQYTYSLTDELSNVNLMSFCQKIIRILFHEHIPRLPMGIMNRTKSLKVEVYQGTTWGLAVLPFSRILRYFTPNINFMVYGVQANVAYFKTNQSLPQAAQYRVQSRQVFLADDDWQAEITYPCVGFIEIDKLKPIEISHNSHYPYLFANFAKSWVFHYRHYGILYQTYCIWKLNSAKITEYLIIDTKKNILTITMEINNGNNDVSRPESVEKTDLRYYPTMNPSEVKLININERAVYRTVYDIIKKDYTVDKIPSEDVFKFPMVFGDENEQLRIHLLKDDLGAVVFDHDKPVIYAPEELIEETETVEITKDMFIDKGITNITNTTTFIFNERLNQYCSSHCPES